MTWLERLIRVATRLVSLASQEREPGARRRMLTVTVIALFLGAVGVAGVCLSRPGGTPAFAAMAVLAAMAWLCARAGRAVLAGVLAMLACAALPYWGFYSPEASTSMISEVVLLLLAVQVAGLGLSLSAYVPAVLGHTAVALTLLAQNPGVPRPAVIELGIYLFVTVALTAIYVGVRSRSDIRIAAQFGALRETNRALERARREAESASAMKSRFLANTSHEIRTPLNSVIGLTEVLMAGELSPEQRRYLSLIHESGEALLGLINDILDLSKIEAGAIEVDARPFDVRALLRQSVAILAERAERKGLAIVGGVDEAVPAYLIGDSSLLRQVLINLLGNAVKFTDRGAVTATVGPAGPGRWRFEVSDTGVGISAADQARLFESFYQVKRSDGTGLGLAICKHLVDQMGGAIELSSRVGEGSRFSFVLSLPAGEAPARDGDPAAGPDAPVRAVGRAVLVVDDNPVNRLVAVRLLEQLGATVTALASGREAIDAVRERAFGVVFMDCEMPELDGVEAAARIRAEEAERGAGWRTPIVAFTAHATEDERARCLSAGMDDFVTKPIREDELARVLTRWCAGAAPPATGAGRG